MQRKIFLSTILIILSCIGIYICFNNIYEIKIDITKRVINKSKESEAVLLVVEKIDYDEFNILNKKLYSSNSLNNSKIVENKENYYIVKCTKDLAELYQEYKIDKIKSS